LAPGLGSRHPLPIPVPVRLAVRHCEVPVLLVHRGEKTTVL
jgi:hypothetical protein